MKIFIKENWFKMSVVVFGFLFIVFLFCYQEKIVRRGDVFKICMSTVPVEVLKDYTKLKDNLQICEELSSSFK